MAKIRMYYYWSLIIYYAAFVNGQVCKFCNAHGMQKGGALSWRLLNKLCIKHGQLTEKIFDMMNSIKSKN